jgi:hypothetical protein
VKLGWNAIAVGFGASGKALHDLRGQKRIAAGGVK